MLSGVINTSDAGPTISSVIYVRDKMCWKIKLLIERSVHGPRVMCENIQYLYFGLMSRYDC